MYKCARSTPVGSILELLKPFFDFVDEAIDSGRSVLVQCVAGAHRAATAGCLLLMHYHQLGAKVRVHTAPTVMPTTPPWSLHSLWVRPDRMPRRLCASATSDRAEARRVRCSSYSSTTSKPFVWSGVWGWCVIEFERERPRGFAPEPCMYINLLHRIRFSNTPEG